MYKENDLLVYKKDVCKVKCIKEINNIKYYVLTPINDSSLTITIPIDNNMIRNIISKKEALNIIKAIPSITPIEVLDEKYIEHTYKKLLNNPTYENLIKIIKTSYLRNDYRNKNNKKDSEKDKYYFDLAEKYLYTELSIPLNKDYESTKEYIINEVEKLI